MKKINMFLILSSILLLPLLTRAQFKYEKEHRVNDKKIPLIAKAIIDSIAKESKIVWFEEVSLTDITFEAKFKHEGVQYSVEFDTLGILQDLEYVVLEKEIEVSVYGRIESQLDALYEKWKIQKIQRQYNGALDEILNALRNKDSIDQVEIFYEIVLKGKKLGYAEQYQITFNQLGVIRAIEQLIQDKSDHLDY